MFMSSLKFVGVLAASLAVVACASTSANDDLTFPGDDNRSISYDELTEPDNATDKSPTPRSQILNNRRSSKNDRQACESAFERIVTPVRALAAINGASPIQAGSPLAATLTLKNTDCQLHVAKRQLIHALYLAAHAHTGRVLALLPLTGPMNETGNAILSGMRKAYVEKNLDFDRLVSVRDTRGDSINTEKILAQTILSEPIAAIVGGVTSGEARILSSWAPRLSMPTVLVSPESPDTMASAFTFRVFPSEKLLAQAMVDYVNTRGIKNVGILRPWRSSSPTFLDEFIKQGAAVGIKVTQDVSYNRDDFHSMEAAAQKLFKIDIQERAEEYAELVETKRAEATDAGGTFNPRTVALSPIVDFDAVLIPDNFRTVRHFVQIFKYFDVRKLQLIGTHEWRSSALIEPYEPYLNGAIFPDFIGSYQKLPPGIEVTTSSSPNFVHPDSATQLDYTLIGYHAASFLAPAVADTDLMRREIAKELQDTKLTNQVFFANGKVFDDNRNSLWPSFIFSVTGKDIVQVR